MAEKRIIDAGGSKPDGLQLGTTGEKLGFLGTAPIARQGLDATSTAGTAAAASADLSALAAETEKIGDDVRAILAALKSVGLLENAS